LLLLAANADAALVGDSKADIGVSRSDGNNAANAYSFQPA
jgi:hypothetical protein